MLTALDLGTNRQTFLPYGTELGASGQVERLQQALLALSKTGLPLANPGSITGQLNKQTVLASLYAVAKGDLDLGWALKAQLVALAWDAASALGTQVETYLSGSDEALAQLMSAIESAAPVLTSAVMAATQKRTVQSGSAKDLLTKWARFTPTSPQEIAPVAPGQRSSVFTPAGNGKAGTYLMIGVAVLGLGGLAFWLIK